MRLFSAPLGPRSKERLHYCVEDDDLSSKGSALPEDEGRRRRRGGRGRQTTREKEREREKCCATRVNVKWLSSEEREKDGGEKKNEK